MFGPSLTDGLTFDLRSYKSRWKTPSTQHCSCCAIQPKVNISVSSVQATYFQTFCSSFRGNEWTVYTYILYILYVLANVQYIVYLHYFKKEESPSNSSRQAKLLLTSQLRHKQCDIVRQSQSKEYILHMFSTWIDNNENFFPNCKFRNLGRKTFFCQQVCATSTDFFSPSTPSWLQQKWQEINFIQSALQTFHQLASNDMTTLYYCIE